MLTAFNARSIFELGAKDRFRIDSLLAYGDKLILGLSTGALRIYRVDSPDTPDVSLSLLRTVENFSRRRIEILTCIKEAGILVSLADSNVHIHDLNDLTLTETLSKARGASTLAVTSNVERDDETQIPSIVSRLAIGVKRKLLMYSWADGGFREGREVTLAGNIRTLTWASGKKIVVGLYGGFVVVDVETAVVEEVSPSEGTNGHAKAGEEKAGWASYVGMGGWGSKSLSTRLSGEELLLVKDASTLFIDTSGKPLPGKPPIPWSTPPDAIAFSYPYLISLHAAKHLLEVRNPSTRTLLQTIPLPTVTMLHVPPPNVSLVHAGKLFYVASPMQVWRMGATDYETQINNLIEAGQLDEAIRLLEMLESVLLSESKEEKLREVKMLKAQKLFERGKYEVSMALFGEVSAPPDRVIKLFPPVIAGELSIWPEKDDDVEDEEAEEPVEDQPSPQNGDIREPATEKVADDDAGSSKDDRETGENEESSEVKSDSRGGSSGRATPEQVKPLSRSGSPELKKQNGVPVEPAYGSIRNIAFTRKYGETASIFSFGSRRVAESSNGDNSSLATKNEREPVDETPKALHGEQLKKATNELARTFLNDVRRKLTKYFDANGTPADPVVILSVGSAHEASREDPLEASFLKVGPEEFPDLEPAQARIEKVVETCRIVDTALFRSYILTRPALVGPLVRIQNHCNPDVVSQKLREQGKFEDLVDFLERKQLHREALELLRFFGQAEDDSKAPNLHGPQRTITYLERLKAEHINLIFEFATWPLRVDPKLAMEIFIGDTGNSDSLPRVDVLDFLERQDQVLAIQYLDHIIRELHDLTPEFHTRLARLYLAALSHVMSDEETSTWHERLLHFLTTSDQYRAEKVLGWLPRDTPSFYECRAVVLSKMGNHKAALEIYVFRLQDHEKAEDYCTRVHLSSAAHTEEGKSVYYILLSLYLRPPAPYPRQLDPALQILSRHGARLEAAEALGLIPENIKIQDLEGYFERRIRAANARVVEDRITAALRKSFLVDVQEKLVECRNVHVEVREENVCPICHKRLGLSVIWRLPSGQVVHYGCAKKGMAVQA